MYPAGHPPKLQARYAELIADTEKVQATRAQHIDDYVSHLRQIKEVIMAFFRKESASTTFAAVPQANQ